MVNNVIKRNNVTVKGKGKQSMLFAPGFGCDQTVWDSVTCAFEDDYQLILFDYVGFGKTDVNAYDKNKYNNLKGYIDDLLEICTSLDLKDVIFVGHSIGGMIGLLASLEKKDLFSRLILLGPSPRYLNDAPDYLGGFTKEEIDGLIDMMEKNYVGWASAFASTAMNDSERPELVEILEKRFLTSDPMAIRQFAEITFFIDTRSELAKVTVPSLILQSENDLIVPPFVAEYIKEKIPNSSLKRINAIGHLPHVSHPQETIKHIDEYLQSS